MKMSGAAVRRLCVTVMVVAAGVRGDRASGGQCRFKHAGSSDAVTYRVSLENALPGVQLKIRMSFHVEAGVPVAVDVPSDLISDLHVEDSKADLRDGSSGEKVVTAPVSRIVSLSYNLRNGWAGPLVHPHEFQPVIHPEYLEVTGDKALVSLSRSPDALTRRDWKRKVLVRRERERYGRAGRAWQ